MIGERIPFPGSSPETPEEESFRFGDWIGRFLRIIVTDPLQEEREVVGKRRRPVSEKKGVLLPVCVVCDQTPPRGIGGGILVSGHFLCTRCEQEIVRARVGDGRYFQIKEKIKKIWGHAKPGVF